MIRVTCSGWWIIFWNAIGFYSAVENLYRTWWYYCKVYELSRWVYVIWTVWERANSFKISLAFVHTSNREFYFRLRVFAFTWLSFALPARFTTKRKFSHCYESANGEPVLISHIFYNKAIKTGRRGIMNTQLAIRLADKKQFYTFNEFAKRRLEKPMWKLRWRGFAIWFAETSLT